MSWGELGEVGELGELCWHTRYEPIGTGHGYCMSKVFMGRIQGIVYLSI